VLEGDAVCQHIFGRHHAPITEHVALEIRVGRDSVMFEMREYAARRDYLPEPEKRIRHLMRTLAARLIRSV
jgi:hypothetical protein